MMKHLIFCLLALSWAAPLFGSPEATVRTRHATGRVIQYGSGTVIAVDADGFDVLSCCHPFDADGCVAGGTAVVTTRDGKDHVVRRLAWDRKTDLVLLRASIRGVKIKPVSLAEASEKCAPGLPVTIYGHPMALEFTASEGVVLRGAIREASGLTSLLTDARSVRGVSGGGVCRKSDGKLVGVLWGGQGEASCVRRLADVREFLAWARE